MGLPAPSWHTHEEKQNVVWLQETSLTNSSLSVPPSFRRFTRSNSVTTAVQADLDFHDNLENSLESIEDNSCPGPVARQFSRDASTSTVSIQGSGNHYHACAVDEDFDADFDPSILPPPDPWIDSITEDPLEAVQRSVCHRDGHWFLKLLQAERDRMEGWCQQMEREERENNLPEESKCVAAYAHAQTPGAMGGASGAGHPGWAGTLSSFWLRRAAHVVVTLSVALHPRLSALDRGGVR